jgi:hypothetical protein
MDEVRAFAVAGGRSRPVTARRFRSEADLRRFVTRHAPTLLGVTVLASEYPIATDGGGRIDALALDERDRPVVLEFKRSASGTAICQGLYYLDWIESHRDAFSLLVVSRFGPKVATRVAWGAARLLCLAEEIGEREEAVARQIGRTVELLAVRRYPSGLVVVQRPAAGSHRATDGT